MCYKRETSVFQLFFCAAEQPSGIKQKKMERKPDGSPGESEKHPTMPASRLLNPDCKAAHHNCEYHERRVGSVRPM